MVSIGCKGYLKGLLLGAMFLLSIVSKAQIPQLLPKDSNQQTDAQLDSAKEKAREESIYSDTSMTALLTRLEDRVLQLNKDLSLLRQGFDTSNIIEELPEIEQGLEQVEATLGRIQARANLRNLNSFKVIIQQVQIRIKKLQDILNGYSGTLVKIGENQSKYAADSLHQKMPGDSLLRLSYLEKLNPMLQKKVTVDSMLAQSLKSIGLLQTRVSSSYFKSAELIDQVNNNIKNYQSHFLQKDAPYLWQAGLKNQERSFFENIKLGFRRNIGISVYFIKRNLGALFLTFFLGALFFALNRISVHRLKKSETPNWDLPLHFLKNKIWLPTLLVIFTFLPFIMQNPPAGLVQFLWLFMLITATLIRWKDWPVNFRRMWLGIFGFFIIFSIDSFLPSSSYAERWVLALLNIAAITLGWYMFREVLKDKSRYHQLMDESIIIFMIFNLLAFVMNLSGRLSLARVGANTGLMSITMLLSLQIVREILLEFVYLQVEAYKHSRLTGLLEFNKLKERFRTTLSIVTIVLWLMALLWSLNLNDIIQEWVGNFLTKERGLGQFTFSLSSILIFVGIIWLSMLLGRLVSFIFHGEDSTVVGSRKGKRGSLILFVKLGIYTVGLLIAFAAAGIAMDKLAIVVGALGVGIGFGLQNIVNNLVSGIILAVEKPMEIGDVIELGTRVGTVKEIGFRSSKISTFEGSVIIVPNGDFISQQLINWTHSNNNYRRVDITVGVKYGSNLEKVKNIINDIIQVNPDVAKYPAPAILINEFADNSVNIRVLFWTADYDKWVLLKSQIFQQVYEAFAENNIEIPFPQTDLHLKSIDPVILEALRGNATAPPKEN